MKASKFLCLMIQALFVFEYAGVEGLKCYVCSYTWHPEVETGKECIYGTETSIERDCQDRPYCTLSKRYSETWGPIVQSFNRGCDEGLVNECRYDSATSNAYTCTTVCNTDLCNTGVGKSLPPQVTTSTTTTTTRTPRRIRLGNKGTYLVSDQALTYILLLAFSLVCWG